LNAGIVAPRTQTEDDMHSSKRPGWLLPWLVLTAASASGQEAVSPLPGMRLRVTARELAPKPIVGDLVQITEDEIVLAQSASDRTVVPRASAKRVEWSRGRHGNAVKGLLIGGAIGAAVFSVANAQDPETGDAQEYLLVALVGAGVGALPGAAIGALVKTERWAELPLGNLRVTVGATSNRGVGLRLAWAW
jgi:hypothetical protein